MQALQFQILAPYYLRDYRSARLKFMEAYLHRQRLFPESPSDKTEDEQLSPDEVAEILRMASAIKFTPRPAKQLKG